MRPCLSPGGPGAYHLPRSRRHPNRARPAIAHAARDPRARLYLAGDADADRHRAAAVAAGLVVEVAAGATATVPAGPPGILAVLTPPEDRAYRVEVALRQGWYVLAPAPVVPSATRARSLHAAAAEGEGVLAVEAPFLHSGFAAQVRAALQDFGPVAYVRLQLGVPRRWLAGRPEGILESEALWAPWLLERLFGPIDTVAAHTRALVRQRPTEDMALAHLEFVNGVEGAFEAHALGDDDEGTLTLCAYGAGGQVRVGADPLAARAAGLQAQYRGLAAGPPAAAGKISGHGAPMTDRGGGFDLDTAALPGALALATWIRQSARLGLRLPRRERPPC